MENQKSETYYLISESDAYRIEGLISTLAMAVWEILRQGEMISQPPEESDANTALDMFSNETARILKPSKHEHF